MNLSSIDYCLIYVTDRWRSLKAIELGGEPAIQPPWGVWIRQYDDLAPGAASIGQEQIQAAWFLSASGMEPRDPLEYARFILANSYPPPKDRRENSVFGRVHKIAMAAFAGYSDTSMNMYVEYIWGTRWGEGVRLTFGDDGNVSTQERLWLS